jgi:hypothetical protein
VELAVVTSRVSSSPDPVPRKVHKVQIGPRNQLCARHHRVARIERPFGFGGEPVTTRAVGDLISVALPTITTPGSTAAAWWRSRSTATTRTRSRARSSTAARPAAPGPRPASCWRHRRSRRRTGHVRRRNTDRRHDLGRQRQPEPDHAGELGQLTFGFFLRGKLF